jgi:hypothetical protein
MIGAISASIGCGTWRRAERVCQFGGGEFAALRSSDGARSDLPLQLPSLR